MTFPTNLQEREAYILEKVAAREFEHYWVPITNSYNGNNAVFYVSGDCLKIDGVRVNMSAYLQQQCADILGASLLTAKLADLIHLQADIHIDPITRPITSDTSAMIDQSEKIDNAIKTKYPNEDLNGKLISSLCKFWLIDNLLNVNKTTACNYGWFCPGNSPWKGIATYPCASLMKNPETGSYFRVIQQPSTAHNYKHSDYSQSAIFVMNLCEVNENQMLLSNVLTNKDLAPLASYQGVMNILRQPQIPIYDFTT